jgi:hypothetical protein
LAIIDSTAADHSRDLVSKSMSKGPIGRQIARLTDTAQCKRVRQAGEEIFLEELEED